MNIGLRDIFYAPITTNTDGSDTYGTPVRMARAISADVSANIVEETAYSDDSTEEVFKEFVDGELALGVNDLTLNTRAALLGQKLDDDGVLISHENDDPPYVAVGFRARKNKGQYDYIWLYKIKFSPPSESYETKGSGISIKTPTITGKYIKRYDGNWKAHWVGSPEDALDTVAAGWFDEVREPNFAPENGD